MSGRRFDLSRKLVWVLVAFDLLNPAFLLLLLCPVLFGRARICNAPAIAFRGVVSFIFLLAALALVTGAIRIGRAVSISAVILNLAMISWIWSDSGILLNLEITAWFIVAIAVPVVSIAMGRRGVEAIGDAGARIGKQSGRLEP